MAVFNSKDFTGPNTLRIRNMIAARLGVAPPATSQQCTDYVTSVLQRETKAYEDDAARAAINNSEPD